MATERCKFCGKLEKVYSNAGQRHDCQPPPEGLTAAQRRMYLDLGTGTKTYNGRARRPAQALADAGLVTISVEFVPQAKGDGIELVQQITVQRTDV